MDSTSLFQPCTSENVASSISSSNEDSSSSPSLVSLISRSHVRMEAQPMVTLPSHSNDTCQGLEDILSAVLDIIDDDTCSFLLEHDPFQKLAATPGRFGAAKQ